MTADLVDLNMHRIVVRINQLNFKNVRDME